jgi:glucuronoarabinoxylan endo-1,4-beta-xylanase
MHHTSQLLTGVTLSILMGSAGLSASTVTIDPSREYQTIEGFGSTYNRSTTSAAYMAFLHDDVGYTMVRLFMPFESFQTRQGGPFNVNDGVFQGNLGVLNGLKNYPDVRFITTIWSPPGWMKYHGDVNNGDSLLPAMMPALADYFLGLYNAILQQTGVRLYGLSIQNEPAFVEPYVSCVYPPAKYRDLLKVVGKRFADEGIDIKLYGAEDMLDFLTMNPYPGTINADATAKGYFDALAVHGYTDGVNPQPTSGQAQSWGRLATISKAMGKSAWMTETSGFPVNWSGAMTLASNIYAALRYGNLSLWTFWEDNRCDAEGLLCNGAHTQRSLVSKNFYRYIRPGAVRIAATPDDTACYAVAFNNKAAQTLTLVIYNAKASGYALSLSGANLPAQFTKYTTTASKACVNEGTVGATSISIDASSVTTLVGSGYNPPTGVDVQPRRHASGMGAVSVGESGVLRMYDVNGRLSSAMPVHAAGVYLAVRGNAFGRVAGTAVIVTTSVR